MTMNVCTRHPAGAELKLTVWTLFVIFLCLLLPVTSYAASAPLRLEVKNTLTSYYGSKLDGSKTATGQRHDSEGLMAAHRNLPFGTVLRVTNLSNGRDVLVRINDRGPFSPRLGLDISQAAARELNIIRAGIASVQTEVVSDASGRSVLPGMDFFVDLGTVAGSAPAARVEADLASLNDVRLKTGKSLPAVRVFTKALPDAKGRRFLGMGPFNSFVEAENAFKALKKHWPRTKVICAAMAPESTRRFVASVVADDVPKVVQDYTGKASLKQSKGSKKQPAKSKGKNKRSRSRAEQEISVADKDTPASKAGASSVSRKREKSQTSTVASASKSRKTRSEARASRSTGSGKVAAQSSSSRKTAAVKSGSSTKRTAAVKPASGKKTAAVKSSSSKSSQNASRSSKSRVRTAYVDKKSPATKKTTTRRSGKGVVSTASLSE